MQVIRRIQAIGAKVEPRAASEDRAAQVGSMRRPGKARFLWMGFPWRLLTNLIK